MCSIRFCCLFITLCSLALFSAMAQNAPQATASLSQTTMAPGDAVTLTVEVSGANKIDPPTFAVPGLDIRYSGHRQNAQITNNRVFASVALFYRVESANPGNFTIPIVGVATDVGELKTQPLTLTVQAPTPGAKPAGAGGALAFAT